MRYEIKIALEFLRYSKGQTIFIVSAIALGVAVQIFISSLISSLQVSLIYRILGTTPHITINSGDTRDELRAKQNIVGNYGNISLDRDRIPNYEKIIEVLSENDEIKLIVPTVEGSAIYKTMGKNANLNIVGMDLKNADSLYNIKDRIIEGNSSIYSNNVLIGIKFSRDFRVDLGDQITLTLPNSQKEVVRVVGIFDLENQGVNKSMVVMDIDRAKIIFGKVGYVTDINIQTKDVFEADNVSDSIKDIYPELEVTSWTQDGAALLKALQSQTDSSIIIQSVVMLATAMSISSVLIVTVLQKIKEIGILKAMGAKDKSTGMIFLIQGGVIGFCGSVLGIVFGKLVISTYTYFAKPTFTILISNEKLIAILIFSTMVGILSGIIPALRCMKLSPIEVIKS